MLIASAIPRARSAQATAATILCQPREIVGAEQRAARRAMVTTGSTHPRVVHSRWEPLDSLAVDLDIDILTVLAAPAVDHIGPVRAEGWESGGSTCA